MMQKNELNDVTAGVLTVLGINFILWPLIFLFKINIPITPCSFIQLILVYVIPLVILLIVKKRWFFMMGVISGAFYTLFLNFILLFILKYLILSHYF